MAKKTRKDVTEEIIITEGVNVNVEGNVVKANKDGKELSRKIDDKIKITLKDNKLILEVKNPRRAEKRIFGTSVGHIKNMITGLNDPFVYELEMCNVHFPMTIDFDKGKKEFAVKNMLGEKFPRKVVILGDVEVEIKAPRIIIKSYDIEAAGRAASRLESITKVRNRDRNKFQDGIFITKKPGKEY